MSCMEQLGSSSDASDLYAVVVSKCRLPVTVLNEFVHGYR
jgi:hypothetical protein